MEHSFGGEDVLRVHPFQTKPAEGRLGWDLQGEEAAPFNRNPERADLVIRLQFMNLDMRARSMVQFGETSDLQQQKTCENKSCNAGQHVTIKFSSIFSVPGSSGAVRPDTVGRGSRPPIRSEKTSCHTVVGADPPYPLTGGMLT